jgi:uncharacterized protein DUF5719
VGRGALGHEEAGAAMRGERPARARGQGLLAVALAVVAAAMLAALDRAGARDPAGASAGQAPSGAWLCPHGGGQGWSVAVFLANPGDEPVTARVTELGGQPPPSAPQALEVPPGTSVRVDVAPADPGASTFVEYFGGWIGAGWVTMSSADGEGVAAEPCAAEAARRWLLPDATTQLGEDASVVIANPFDVAAVLDVAIFTADRAPIRDSEWTDLTVPPRRSIALRLNEKVEGEPAVGVELRVSVGRVAAASLGVTDATKVRSTLGSTRTATGAVFPVAQGSGQTELLVLSTADESLLFGATSLTADPPAPAGGLIEQQHGPTAVRAYAIPVEAESTGIEAFVVGDARVSGALRALGSGEDRGSTGGAAEAAPAWVLFPAAAGGGTTPAAVLVNATGRDAVVTLETLDGEDGTTAAPVTVDVPARSAAAVPSGSLASAPAAAVLVRSEGAQVVALAASTSAAEAFALSLGVPLPQGL